MLSRKHLKAPLVSTHEILVALPPSILVVIMVTQMSPDLSPFGGKSPLLENCCKRDDVSSRLMVSQVNQNEQSRELNNPLNTGGQAHRAHDTLGTEYLMSFKN